MEIPGFFLVSVDHSIVQLEEKETFLHSTVKVNIFGSLMKN